MKIHVCDGCGVDLDGSHMVLHKALQVPGVEEVCRDCYAQLVEALISENVELRAWRRECETEAMRYQG